MILKNTVQQRILTNKMLSLSLALELKVNQEWVRTLAKRNEKNGPLTTAACVAIIKNDMGILEDSEVLEKEIQPHDAPAT